MSEDEKKVIDDTQEETQETTDLHGEEETPETETHTECDNEAGEEAETKTEEPEGTEASESGQEDYKDKWLRVTAEYQNYRTRTMKEKADLYQTASFEIVKELIGVIDNFELALKNIQDEKTREGIELIYKQLWSVLEKNHVKEIPAMDLPVDLAVHNMIAEIPFEGKEAGIVVDVTKKGYTQGDRVIRPADVVVSR